MVVVGSVAAATSRDRTPPTTPTNLRVTSLSHKSVTLAWDPSTDNSGSFSYSVNKDGQSFTVPQTRTTYTIDWLSAGRSYTFYVTAVDKALNQSGQSNTVTVTTPRDTTPPTAPVLSGTVRGPSQVSLTWTQSTDDLSTFVGYRFFAWNQSTDDTDPQYAIEYEIYVNGVLSPLAVGAGIDRDFVYGTAGVENTFTVKAVDRAGNTSEASIAVTAVC